MHSMRNLGTAPADGSTPRGSWSTCHECHEGSAVDDFAADQLSVPNDEMLGDLDIRPAKGVKDASAASHPLPVLAWICPSRQLSMNELEVRARQDLWRSTRGSNRGSRTFLSKRRGGRASCVIIQQWL
jgi:hypothetical protein